MRRSGAAVALVVALVVAACGGGEASDDGGVAGPTTVAGRPDGTKEPFGPFDEGAVEITAPDGTTTCSCVLVADTREERAQGLMHVTDLGGFDGMLFVFARPSNASFHMRDTPMPLSIAFFDDRGGVVSTADMAPCLEGDCPSYPAAGPYRLALEVPQGRLGAVGVEAGSVLRIVEGCPS